jgi:hypothetical protein
MIRKYFLILIMLCLCYPSNAKETEAKNYKNYYGVNAGYTSGLGFSYAYWPGKLGVQVSVLPISTDDIYLFSIALTPFYTLSKTKYFKSYLFLGNHLVTNNEVTEYNIGFGPGIEVGSRVVYSVRGGIGLFDVTNTFCILPTFEMGLFFKF